MKIRPHNFLALFAQEFEKFVDIKRVMQGSVWRKIFLSELKQSHSRLQAAAVLWMRRMFEVFFQMNKCACRLNKPLEEISVVRIRFQPQLLQNIMRFVVALFIPTTEEGAIK